MTQNPNQPPQGPFPVPQPVQAPGQPPQPMQPVAPSYIPPTVAAAVASPKTRKGASGGTIAFVAAIVVAAAGLGFAGGRLTAPATPARANFTGQFGGNFNGQGGAENPNASGNPARGGFGGIGFGGGNISIDGQVTAVANGSITLQTANGQSVTLQIPSTVTYHTQASGAASDVTVGSKVQVSVTRGTGQPEASGQPQASGQPGLGGRNFQMTVSDITVLSK